MGYAREDYEADLKKIKDLRHVVTQGYLDGIVEWLTFAALDKDFDEQEKRIRGKWGAICGAAAAKSKESSKQSKEDEHIASNLKWLNEMKRSR